MSALRHGSLADQDWRNLLKVGSSVLMYGPVGFGHLTSVRPLGRHPSASIYVKGVGSVNRDVSFFTYIGEIDADGWIHAPESGWGSNPVPGMMVEWRMRDYDTSYADDEARLSDALRWDHIPDAADIIAFRLSHPAPEQVAEASEREAIARIIAPSAFAEIKSRVDGRPTGGLKYADREASRKKALTKAGKIFALIRSQAVEPMVQNFLAWKLPANFNPDNGISFSPTFNDDSAHPMRHEPTGTNLFSHGQAKGMVEHMLGAFSAVHWQNEDGSFSEWSPFERPPQVAHPAPEQVAEAQDAAVMGLLERAQRQIDLGKRTGADGGGHSELNIYVIAEAMFGIIRSLQAEREQLADQCLAHGSKATHEGIRAAKAEARAERAERELSELKKGVR